MFTNPADNSPTIPVAATEQADENIVTRIQDFMDRFIAFPDPDQSLVMALWVLHTHAFDAAYSTPYMYVTSNGPQCGKTRVIDTVKMLTRASENAAQVTSSALFRIIDAHKPTVFIDEVDAIWSGASNEELRGMLNSGYKQGGYVLRTLPGMASEDDAGVAKFSTFCPKLLAGIDNGQLPATIDDRAITIMLKRKRKDQEVERLIPRKVEPQAEALQDEIAHWTAAHLERIMDVEPAMIEEISDRKFEISEPLLAVAKVALDDDGYREVRAAIVRLCSEQVPDTPGTQILKAARAYFEGDGSELDVILTTTLETAVNMPGKRIGGLLSDYGVKSHTINPAKHRPGIDRAKGYYRRDFEDAWSRYL